VPASLYTRASATYIGLVPYACDLCFA